MASALAGRRRDSRDRGDGPEEGVCCRRATLEDLVERGTVAISVVCNVDGDSFCVLSDRTTLKQLPIATGEI